MHGLGEPCVELPPLVVGLIIDVHLIPTQALEATTLSD